MANNWEALKDGDLRLFCFVMVDLVGHSEVQSKNPSRDAQETFRKFLAYIKRHAEANEGQVWDEAGDGALLAFLDNDVTKMAEQATSCALDILDNLDEFNTKERQVSQRLQVRVAVHLGSANYSTEKGTIQSEDINFVAHLEKGGTKPDSVSISWSIYRELKKDEVRGRFLENGIFEGRPVYSTAPTASSIEKESVSPELQLSALLPERIEEALEAVKLQYEPALILTAVPMQQVSIPTLFSSKHAEIVSLLEDPPKIRSNGFDLSTGEQAKMTRGQMRRVLQPGWKVLELWRNGTLIFIADGADDFLAWNSRDRDRTQPLRINQLVLLESTYSFCALSDQVFFRHTQPRPMSIQFRLELRNMTVEDKPCGLRPGPLSDYDWSYPKIEVAPSSGEVFWYTWEGASFDPGVVSFRLVSQVYEWFGIEHDQIPYSKQGEGQPKIDRDQIENAGKRPRSGKI